MTLPSDVNEGINQALEVAHGGQDDRNDSVGVLPCSAEVEKESQANAGSTRRSLSPNTEEVCPDHAQTARQNDSRLCVRQLRKDGQIDVADLATGNAPVKDSPLVGSNSGVSTSARVDAPEVIDRHGDDRFADNIQRALEGLPQNGDDLEEEAAAEEGALIESSGYNDPATNPRFA